MAYLLQRLRDGMWLRYQLPHERPVLLELVSDENHGAEAETGSRRVGARVLSADGQWLGIGDRDREASAVNDCAGPDVGSHSTRGVRPAGSEPAAAPKEARSDGDSSARLRLPELPSDDALAVILPQKRQGPTRYLLVPCAPAPLANGDTQPMGQLAVLRTGDCLAWPLPEGTIRVFFDGFEAARVEPFAGDERRCPICDTLVAVGTPAVVCPGCGIAYHASDDANCLMMASGCSACGHPMALGAESAWVPEGFAARGTCGQDGAESRAGAVTETGGGR